MPRKYKGLGQLKELTRVKGSGGGYDVSTIKHPDEKWFETVVFFKDGYSDEPLITSTHQQAERTHEFTVRIAARLLQPQEV